MRTAFKMFLASILAAVGVYGIAPAASAETTTAPPPACSTVDTTTAQGNCIESKESTASTDSYNASYAEVGTAGKILVRYNMASGIRTTTAENGSGCKLYTSAAKRPASATCIRLARGAAYTNSGIRRGQTTETRWGDIVRAPYTDCKFVKRGSQWYKAGCLNPNTHRYEANCGNKVWFSSPAKITYKQVILVRSFEDWTFIGSASAKSHATASAVAKAWCNQNGSSATATATGNATSAGSATASYQVKGLSKVQAWVSSSSTKVNVTTSSDLDAKAKATAYSVSYATANASAKVTCSGSTPPPQPPSQTPPSIVQYTVLNDVDAGGTSPNFCATVNIPGSDQGTLTFAATYGSFTTSTFAVAGQVQKCTTYVAPTEVPSGGKDTITVFVRDNTTGLSAQSPSQSFPINTPPAPPA